LTADNRHSLLATSNNLHTITADSHYVRTPLQCYNYVTQE